MNEQLEKLIQAKKDDREVAEHAGIGLTLEQYDFLIEQAKRVEVLERENKELNMEIGRYANQLFDIANANFKTGIHAKQLINKMMGGESDE